MEPTADRHLDRTLQQDVHGIADVALLEDLRGCLERNRAAHLGYRGQVPICEVREEGGVPKGLDLNGGLIHGSAPSDRRAMRRERSRGPNLSGIWGRFAKRRKASLMLSSGSTARLLRRDRTHPAGLVVLDRLEDLL